MSWKDKDYWTITGRGDFQGEATIHDTGVMLRMDDPSAPDFWAEVWIPAVVVHRWADLLSAAARERAEAEGKPPSPTAVVI